MRQTDDVSKSVVKMIGITEFVSRQRLYLMEDVGSILMVVSVCQKSYTSLISTKDTLCNSVISLLIANIFKFRRSQLNFEPSQNIWIDKNLHKTSINYFHYHSKLSITKSHYKQLKIK